MSSANLASCKLLGVAPFEFDAAPCVEGRLVNSYRIIFSTKEINIDRSNTYDSRRFLWHKIAFQIIIVCLINLLIKLLFFNYYVTQSDLKVLIKHLKISN